MEQGNLGKNDLEILGKNTAAYIWKCHGSKVQNHKVQNHECAAKLADEQPRQMFDGFWSLQTENAVDSPKSCSTIARLLQV